MADVAGVAGALALMIIATSILIATVRRRNLTPTGWAILWGLLATFIVITAVTDPTFLSFAIPFVVLLVFSS